MSFPAPIPRRDFTAALLCAGLTGLSPWASAQSWPTRPVRIVVPFPPGGASDPMARLMGQKLSEQLGQSFVIENKGGAGTTIGTAEVAKATSDGYTLLLAPAPFAITQFVYAKLPYDGRRAFVPIGLIQTTPTTIVTRPTLGVRTPAEFIELARRNPDKITYGTPGEGTLPHLVGEMLNQQAGIRMRHVPYKGGGPALTDLLAGHIDMSIQTPLIREYVQTGKLTMIGTTALTRTPSTSDWPTFAETVLPGFEALAWFGLMAPAGTPPEVVALLGQNMQKALKDGPTRAKIAESGDVPEGGPQEFAALLQREYQRWERTVKTAGIRAD